MYLLKKSGLVKETTPKTGTTTQRAVQLIDDTDLSRYANRNVLFDTGRTNALGRTRSQRGSPMVNMVTGPIMDDSDRGNPFHYSNMPMIASKLSVTSVDAVPISHGAMRPGGTARLFGGDFIGLVINWLAIGFVSGGTQAFIRPLFTQFFRMQGYQASSALALLDIAWYFKFVLGFLTDLCAMRGERRRPYIYIGWSVVIVAMVVAACLNSVDPYYTHTGLVINEDAASEGSRYLLPLLAASFGLLLVTVACEGTMVELAQRQGVFARGQTQCTLIMFQFGGEFVGSFALGLSTNSVPFGGEFASSMPLQALFGVLGFIAAVGVVATKFLLIDPDCMLLQSMRSQSRSVWEVLRPRPVWQLMVFGFLCSAALSYDVVEKEAMIVEWLDGDALAMKVNAGLLNVGMVVAAWVISSLCLNSNWRTVVITSVVVGVAVALPVELLTTFAVVRSLPLVIVKDQVVGICDALVSVVRQLVIVEIAPPGYEATIFSLLTTVYHLAQPVVRLLVGYLSLAFGVQAHDVSIDTADVRWHVALQQITRVAVRIVVVVLASPLLPRQKRHVKDLLTQSQLNVVSTAARSVFAVFALLLALAATANVLALVESTACLPLAGGRGC